MDFLRSGDDIMIRLDPGEEIHTAIQSLCADLGIIGAALTSGIGRIRDTDIGFLDANGIYQIVVHPDPMELISCQVNVASLEESPFTHIHISLTDDDHQMHGGHLFSGTVHITAELHLRVLDSGGLMTRCSLADSEFKPLSFTPHDSD